MTDDKTPRESTTSGSTPGSTPTNTRANPPDATPAVLLHRGGCGPEGGYSAESGAGAGTERASDGGSGVERERP